MPFFIVIAETIERPHGPFNLFAVNDPIGEVIGIFEEMLLPIAACTVVAMALLRGWVKNVKTQSLLAISMVTGTVLTSIFYIVLLALIPIIRFGFGDDTFYNIIARALAMAIFFTPALFVMGPITVGCLVRARQGKIFLSNRALYSATVLILVLQYFWLVYFLSGS